MLSAVRQAINPDDFLTEFSNVTSAVQEVTARQGLRTDARMVGAARDPQQAHQRSNPDTGRGHGEAARSQGRV